MRPWRRKAALLSGLLTGDRVPAGPDYVNIDVTHRCNLQCYYCRWHSPLVADSRLPADAPRDLPLETFDALCEDLRRLGGRSVQCVGAGEPLLHPQIFDMIHAAKRRGLHVLLYTNGTLLQGERLRAIAASGLDVLRVSLGATSGEEYARKHPRATPAEFERVVAGMRDLAGMVAASGARGPSLELTHAIGRDSAATLDRLGDLARTAGCSRVHFSLVIDFGEAGIEPYTLPREQWDDVRAASRAVERRLQAIGIGCNVNDLLLRHQFGPRVWDQVPCYTAWFGSYVRTDGGVLVCQRSDVPVGYLAAGGFEKTWNGPDYRAFRRQTLQGAPPASVQHGLDCRFCPHAVNNHRVHRVFRWLRPLRRLATRVAGAS